MRELPGSTLSTFVTRRARQFDLLLWRLFGQGANLRVTRSTRVWLGLAASAVAALGLLMLR
jgi:hypothetical protein